MDQDFPIMVLSIGRLEEKGWTSSPGQSFRKTLIGRIHILFLTKKNEWILDPFMGTGSALLSAGKLHRNAVGYWTFQGIFWFYRRRIKRQNYLPINSNLRIIAGIRGTYPVEVNRKNMFDYVITSPPYWNQLERNSLRQKIRLKKGLSTKYSEIRMIWET